MIKTATAVARRLWADGYVKAGVITVDLVPLATSQRAPVGAFERERGEALMAALDACHQRGAVVPGAAGFAPQRGWSTKFEMRSPRHTTRISDILFVNAA